MAHAGFRLTSRTSGKWLSCVWEAIFWRALPSRWPWHVRRKRRPCSAAIPWRSRCLVCSCLAGRFVRSNSPHIFTWVSRLSSGPHLGITVPASPSPAPSQGGERNSVGLGIEARRSGQRGKQGRGLLGGRNELARRPADLLRAVGASHLGKPALD